MEYKNYEHIDAKKEYDKLVEKYTNYDEEYSGEYQFQIESKYNLKYKTLRDEVINKLISNNIKLEKNKNDEGKSESKYKYKFDVNLGLILHTVLNITEREASDNAYWEFLHLKIFPDILIKRWGLSKERIIKGSKDTRLYFKSIWWYAHIGLYNSTFEDAQKILLNDCLDTDSIVNIVERTGKNGYNLIVLNAILRMMLKYPELNSIDKVVRKLMFLNTAQTQVIVPNFYKNNVFDYAEDLIKKFLENERKKEE